MKKHDEGYVLAFVMVVVAVLSLISLAVSTMAVRNIETQQAAVDRRLAKYEVEGAVEIVIAEMSNLSSLQVDAGDTFEEAIQEEIEKSLPATLDMSIVVTPDPSADNITVEEMPTDFSYKFNLAIADESNTVSCDMELKGKVAKDSIGVHTITDSMVAYLSYEMDVTEITAPTTEPSVGGVTG